MIHLYFGRKNTNHLICIYICLSHGIHCLTISTTLLGYKRIFIQVQILTIEGYPNFWDTLWNHRIQCGDNNSGSTLTYNHLVFPF